MSSNDLFERPAVTGKLVVTDEQENQITSLPVEGTISKNGPFLRGTIKGPAPGEPTEKVALSLIVAAGGGIHPPLSPELGVSHFWIGTDSYKSVGTVFNNAVSSFSADTLTLDLNNHRFVRTSNNVESNVLVSIDLTRLDGVVEGGVGVPQQVAEKGATARIPLGVRVNETGSSFDSFGALNATNRLSNERNFFFAERVRDAIANPGGAEKISLVHGIIRDLGLARKKGIEIVLGTELAALAGEHYSMFRLHVEGGRVKLYSAWLSGKNLDGRAPWQLARIKLGESSYIDFDFVLASLTVGQLVDKLNSAVLTVGNSDYRLVQAVALCEHLMPAACLIDYDSRVFHEEVITPTEIVGLTHKNLVPGSLSVEANRFYSRERSTVADVVLLGDYHIDTEAGLLYAKGAPEEQLSVFYIYHETKMTLEVSGLQAVDLQSEYAQETFFAQIAQEVYETEEEKTVNGMPNNKMFEIIRKLVTAGKIGQRWGE